MAGKKQSLKKLTYTKKVVCAYCKYEPVPEDLGKLCPKCNGRYTLVDIEQRQPFAQDERWTGGI